MINLSSPSNGSPGYVTAVRLIATGIEARQQATLTVTCGARAPAAYTAEVGPPDDGGLAELRFEDVAFPDDASCTLAKQHGMLSLLLEFHELAAEALRAKIPLARVLGIPEREELARLREIAADKFEEGAAALREKMRASFDGLREKGERA